MLRRLLLVACAAAALLVLLLETIPRWIEIPGLRLRDLDPLAFETERARIEPHPYLAYAPKPNFRTRPDAKHRIAHNSLGFRGPEIPLQKPPGVQRVLCLGGSSTYGHGPTSNETTWPMQLEAMLREALAGREIQVINGGCQGYSTFESLANLEFRCLELEPDLVIVYHTINDMRCALYPNVRRDNTHWRAVWTRERQTVLTQSYTYLVARAYLTDYLDTATNLGRFVIVDFDGTRDPYAWREDSSVGFRNFYRNLNSIITLAEAHGAKVLLGKQAIRRSDLDGAPSREDQLRAFDYLTGVIGVVAKERHVALADPQGVLERERRRQVAEKGSDTLFMPHGDVHVTDEGAQWIARVFADAILDQNLLPAPAGERER